MHSKFLLPAMMAALAASGASAKERKPSSASLPENCEKAARATIVGATSADGNDDPADVEKGIVFSNVKVTKRGEIPPADGVTDIGFKARFKSDSFASAGTIKARVMRSGCLIELMDLDSNP